MRQLLARMRREGNIHLLSQNQKDFFKKYKRILRDFVRPNERDLLARKRYYMNRNMPFSEAFGKSFIENPQAFDNILKSMDFH